MKKPKVDPANPGQASLINGQPTITSLLNKAKNEEEPNTEMKNEESK